MSDSALLEFHAFCLTNTGTRVEQYARALAGAVRPGDAVLDLGAGAGILSFLACRAGARRVFAVEASDSLAYGRRLLSAAGVGDRVTFLNASSFDLTVPEPVDVIVADVHAILGLQQQGLSALLDARDRFLKPGGALLPRGMVLLAAPVEAPRVYAETVDQWDTAVQGMSLAPLRHVAVNTMHPARCTAAQLLAPAAAIATVSLDTTTSLHVGGSTSVRVERPGTLHGLSGSFRTTLADGVDLENTPGASGSTNFAHAFLPIASPVEVSAGDVISMTIDTFDGTECRWIVEVGPGTARAQRFEHSTFFAGPLSPESLARHAPHYRPRLTPRGELERRLLDQFDGTRTVKELEAWLAGQADGVLPTTRAAVLLLKSTIERCG